MVLIVGDYHFTSFQMSQCDIHSIRWSLTKSSGCLSSSCTGHRGRLVYSPVLLIYQIFFPSSCCAWVLTVVRLFQPLRCAILNTSTCVFSEVIDHKHMWVVWQGSRCSYMFIHFWTPALVQRHDFNHCFSFQLLELNSHESASFPL